MHIEWEPLQLHGCFKLSLFLSIHFEVYFEVFIHSGCLCSLRDDTSVPCLLNSKDLRQIKLPSPGA